MRLDIGYTLNIDLALNDNVFYPVIKIFYQDYTADFEATTISTYNDRTCDTLFDDLNIKGLKDLNDLHTVYNVNVDLKDIKKYLPNEVCENIEEIYDILSLWSVDSDTPPEIVEDMFKDYIDDISFTLNKLNICYDKFEYGEY